MLLLLFAMAPVTGSQASSPSGDAVASAKLPKCKLGKVNKRKCRCPQGYKRRKVKGGFRCKKVTPPTPQPGPGPEPVPDPEPNDDGTDNGGTDDGGSGGDDGVAPPADDKVRDDQALTNALMNNAAVKFYSGGGYGSYAYNFFSEGAGTQDGMTLYSMRYCTFYYATGFGNSYDNYNGVWGVKEGYTSPSHPGVAFGRIYMTAGDKFVETPVEVSSTQLALPDLSQYKPFEGGTYELRQGQATSNCAAYETN